MEECGERTLGSPGEHTGVRGKGVIDVFEERVAEMFGSQQSPFDYF